MVYFMEKPIEMDDLGVPLFLGNLHMGKVKYNPLELEAMWVKRVKQCYKPPMTGNGLYNFMYTTYKKGDDWGMVYYCLTHIN